MIYALFCMFIGACIGGVPGAIGGLLFAHVSVWVLGLIGGYG